MNGNDLFFKCLHDNQIFTIFGNPGTTETPFVYYLSQQKDFNYYLSLQEGSVIGIASGYALATGETVIANIHTYPGLANSMCNLHNAFMSQVPLVVTAGQQNTNHLALDPILSGPLSTLAKTSTKYSDEILSVNEMQLKMQRAINLTQQAPKGPVFLSIPMNLFDEETDFFLKLDNLNHTIIGSLTNNDIHAILELLKNDKKIAIVIDQEGSVASNEIQELALNLNADVFASPFSNIQVFNTHHFLYKGALAPFAKAQNKTFEDYDVLIQIGGELGLFLYTKENSIPDHLKVIHINSSTETIGYYNTEYLSVVGDIKKSCQLLADQTKTYRNTNNLENKKVIYENNNKVLEEKIKKDISTQTLNIEGVVFTILEIIDEKTPVIIEAGSYESNIKNLVKKETVGTIFYAPKGGGLGWAMPVAVGVSLAKKRQAVCFVGDGGFNYSLQAIYTAVRYNIPTIFVCLNNKSYEVLKELSHFQYPEAKSVDFDCMDLSKPEINFLKLAEGYGAKSFNCANYSELENIIKTCISNNYVAVINIEVPILEELEMGN